MNNVKHILEKYVRDIAKTIFGDTEIYISILMPDEILGYNEIEFDYLCKIKFGKGSIEQEKVNKLSKLLDKKIQIGRNNIYWFIGESVNSQKHMTVQKKLEKNITLPQFIEDYIFNKLKANFAPNYSKFNKNLHLAKTDVLTYLGTYFPRSFAETYSIFNNIFQNEIAKNSISEKEEINILDIGSGTGGDLSGLLVSLIESNLSNKNINIVAIDGNKESLKILEKIVFQIQLKHKLNLSLNCHYVAFETITDLFENSKQYFDSNFDFIISSKLINEIISKDFKSYFNFYKHFANYLNNEGLILLLDVTTKVGNEYMPILLNKQTNDFIQKESDYKTIIPTICAEYDSICNHDCFTNNFFYVSHKHKKNDKSKVTYRVIVKKNFAQNILKTISVKGSIVGWDDLGDIKYCKFKNSTNNKSGYEV